MTVYETTNHNTIYHWATSRGLFPACVAGDTTKIRLGGDEFNPADEALERKLHYMAVTFAFGIATVIFGFETLFYWERRWVRYLFIAIGIGLFIFGVFNYVRMGPNPLSNFNLG